VTCDQHDLVASRHASAGSGCPGFHADDGDACTGGAALEASIGGEFHAEERGGAERGGDQQRADLV